MATTRRASASAAASIGGPAPKPALERALAVPTALLREAAKSNPGLAGVDVDAAIERAAHEFTDYRGLGVHLELHELDPAAPTVVLHHGLGDHVRRLTPLAQRLHEDGFNAVLVDQPGHGLSEGRRGHCPLPWALDVIELSLGWARARYTGPVILLGDSLGGITSWYALTREPDADAVVCHCIGHPGVYVSASRRWTGMLVRGLARVAPYAPIPIRRIADYDEVALDPATREQFARRSDPVFNWTITARSVASYLEFRPDYPWESVRTPVLVLIGSADGLVTQEFTERCLAAARPLHTTYEALPGLGHQLFLDHLAQTYPVLAKWMREALPASASSTAD